MAAITWLRFAFVKTSGTAGSVPRFSQIGAQNINGSCTSAYFYFRRGVGEERLNAEFTKTCVGCFISRAAGKSFLARIKTKDTHDYLVYHFQFVAIRRNI
jgi:hypothetical protein